MKSSSRNIAFIGTGLMGFPMTERLLEAGHQVAVYNRTTHKAQHLEKFGAKVFSSPCDAIEISECVILMLSEAKAIEDVLFKSTQCDFNNRTVIQMGTIASHESKHFKEKILKSRGEYIECPVLGSRAEAKAGNLILMVGSEKEQFEKWHDFLKAFGPNPYHVGKVGTAAVVKLALNQLIASLATTFSLSIGLLQREGISIEDFMKILRESSLYAPMFDKKLPRMRDRNYSDPNFSVKHLIKDIELFLSETEAKRLSTYHLEGVLEILKNTQKLKFGEGDYSALHEAVNPE